MNSSLLVVVFDWISMEELGRFLVSDGGLLLLVAGESFAYEVECVVDWKKLVFTERTKRRDS